MKRWMVIVPVMICLALGAGIQGFADSGSDKVKAANERAAQDYLKSGLILAGEGRDEEAAKSFRQAIGIKPNWPEAHSLLGSALSRAGKFSEAEAALRQAVTLKPDYAEGWNFLGEFLKERGKASEAQECFKKAQQYAR
jgi:Flp pilus assembly protein TadD